MQLFERLESRHLLNGSITGSVFSDTNVDGVRQANEAGISGQQVYLDLSGRGGFEAADPISVTDANGNYSFPNITPGNYIVRLMNVPAGYTQINPQPIWGGFFWVPLADGQIITAKDFAQQLNVLPNLGSISGKFFIDANSNQSPDAGEAGIAGRQLYLDLQGIGYFVNNDPITTTDASGNYLFQNLRSANYIVRLLNPPAGETLTIPNPIYSTFQWVPLGSGQDFTNCYFGVHTTSVPVIPLSPDNLSLTSPSPAQVAVNFRDNSTNETGFIVERAASASGPFSTITTLSPSAATGSIVSYVDSTVVAGANYFYRVAALGAGGNSYSSFSSITTTLTPPGQPIPLLPGNWALKLDENFNSVDSNLWSSQYWWNRAVGTETSFNPSQVATSNGILSITAQKQSNTVNGVTYPYRSGLLSTGGIKGIKPAGFTFTYGYVETRSKIASGLGMWSALWMLPADYVDNYELDIFENLGRQPNLAQSFYHLPSHPFFESRVPTSDLTSSFHTFGVDWEPDHITWYLDGVALSTYTDSANIINRPMYLILNLDVGGTWAGPLDATSPQSSAWQVDYLRVWQKA